MDVRYCAQCENFKPRAQMRYLDICAACAGRPKKKKPTRRAANSSAAGKTTQK